MVAEIDKHAITDITGLKLHLAQPINAGLIAWWTDERAKFLYFVPVGLA